MVAAVASRPLSTNAAVELLSRAPRDGGIRTAALLAAVIVHLLAFWIPLPERKPPPRVERVAETPAITIYRIPPPALERPRMPPSNPRTPRRSLLPVPETIETAPVDEPELRLDPGEQIVFDAEPIGVVPEAPPLPAVVDETRPGLVRPLRLDRPQPDYPPMARAARREGTVLLRAVIGETGEVRELEVIQAPNPDLGFSRAAIEAVRRWRYEPGRLGGQAVAVSMTVSVVFTLR